MCLSSQVQFTLRGINRAGRQTYNTRPCGFPCISCTHKTTTQIPGTADNRGKCILHTSQFPPCPVLSSPFVLCRCLGPLPLPLMKPPPLLFAQHQSLRRLGYQPSRRRNSSFPPWLTNTTKRSGTCYSGSIVVPSSFPLSFPLNPRVSLCGSIV